MADAYVAHKRNRYLSILIRISVGIIDLLGGEALERSISGLGLRIHGGGGEDFIVDSASGFGSRKTPRFCSRLLYLWVYSFLMMGRRASEHGTIGVLFDTEYAAVYTNCTTWPDVHPKPSRIDD